MKRGLAWGTLACVLTLLAGASVRADKSGGTDVELGGLKSKMPSKWQPVEVSSRTRAVQFRVPGDQGSESDAEVTVFYFGERGAGSPEDNIRRWKSLFVAPEGKTIDDVSKVEKMKLGDAESVYVDIHGTFRFRPTPRSPDSEVKLKPDYRLLEGILQTGKGPYYVRLLGPAKTVEQHKQEFDDWLKAFK
jgi:hypothetical protein